MNLVSPDFLQDGIDNGTLADPAQRVAPPPSSNVPNGTKLTPQGTLSHMWDEAEAAYKGSYDYRFLSGLGHGFRSANEGDTTEVKADQLSNEYGQGKVKVPYDMTRTEAAMYVAEQFKQLDNAKAISDYQAANGGPGVMDKALQLAVGLVTPISLASWGLKPITGMTGALLGKVAPASAEAAELYLGKTMTGKLISGGINVGGFTAALQPFEGALDTAEGKEFSARTFMSNVGMSFIFGMGLGSLHIAFDHLTGQAKADLIEFNRRTGGRIPMEDAIRLTPEFINREAQFGGEKLSMDEHAALSKQEQFSESDQEVLDYLLERQKAAGTLRPDAAEAKPLTPEENTRLEELQRLRAVAKTPQAQVDPLTVKERAEMNDLLANEKKQLSPEQNSEWEALKANKNRTAEENARYKELRDVLNNGLGKNAQAADRLDFLRNLHIGILPDEPAQELFGLLHKQKLSNIKSKYDASFSEQEKTVLQMLQEKKASAQPVNPDTLAQERAQEVADKLKREQATLPPEAPKKEIDHERDVAEVAPDKLERFKDLQDKAKALMDSVAKGIDCITKRL